MQVKKEEQNNLILSSALDEFYEKGYDKSSMRSIATRANMSSGNLYSYYKGKDDLYMTVLSKLMDSLDKFTSQIMKDEKVVESNLESISEAITEMYFSNRKAFMVLMNTSKYSKYRKIFSPLLDAVAARLEKDFFSKLPGEHDKTISYISSRSLLAGIGYIIENFGTDDEKVRELTKQLLELMFADRFAIERIK